MSKAYEILKHIVYHTRIVDVLMLANHDEVGTIRPVGIEYVGTDTVEDILDKVFHNGQNENCNIEAITCNFCSVSCGDVIATDGEFYLIMPCGFKLITDEQLEVYKAVPRRDRSFHVFD